MSTRLGCIILSLLICLLNTTNLFAEGAITQENKQALIFKFGIPGEEVIVPPGDLLSMGNHGSYPSLISYNLILENKGTNSIDIHSAHLTKPESNINTWVPSPLSIAPGENVTLGFLYQTNGTIESVSTGFIFQTNEVGFEKVNFNLIVNPDKGQMEFTSDLLVSEKTIDLGKIRINESKDFTVTMENKGKGFVKIGPASDIQTGNGLILSFGKEEIFGSGTRIYNNGGFKGIKRGEIKSSFSHAVIHGQVDKHTIQVIGQVIAPEAQIEYNSKVLAHDSSLDLNLKLNKAIDAEFIVRNIGDDVLRLHQVKIVGKEKNEIFVLEGNSGKVQPGGIHNVKFRITPRQLGNCKVLLEFFTDDYQRDETLVQLNLLVAGPTIALKDKAGNEIGYNTENQFGICTNGQTFTQKIALKNSGNEDLNLLKIELIGHAQNNLKLNNNYPPTLLPGETINLELEYTAVTPPRSFEKYALRIQSNALNRNDFICDLIVQNHFAQVELKAQNKPIQNTSLYELEQTSVNETKELDFTIENKGTIDLDIEDVLILDDELHYFTISQKPYRIIKPGESGIVKITFAPKLKQYDYTAKLQVKTNDYLLPLFTLKIEGDAIKPRLKVWQTIVSNTIGNGEIIDYGTKTYPKIFTEEYFIKNDSEGQLKFSDLNIEASIGLIIDWEGDKSGTLENGESSSFKVKYQFEEKGDQTVRISFKNNDYNHYDFEFTARFYAEIPEMEIYASNKLDNNSTLKFQDVNEKTLQIKNIGNYAIYINKLSIDGKDKDVFSFDFDKKYVRAGEEESLKIKFNAETSGMYEALLRLETNDKNDPIYELNLTGIRSIYTGIVPGEDHWEPVVYPNPFKDAVRITNLNNEPSEISIYTLIGVKVYSAKSYQEDRTIHLPVPAGIYLLEIKCKDKVNRVKLIKTI